MILTLVAAACVCYALDNLTRHRREAQFHRRLQFATNHYFA